MAENERGEDLNPRSKDVDEKIRQMLDPSVPDPVPEPTKKSAAKPKITQVDIKEPMAETDLSDVPSTAPEVALPVSKSRKVIVPVEHATSDEPNDTAPEPVSEPEPKPVVKIAINHGDEDQTPEAVAEKLDAAIADLEQTPDKPEEEPEAPAEATAPLLDEAPAEVEAPTSDEAPEAEKPEKTEPTEETTEPEEAEPLPEPEIVKDEATEKAVKDIVAKEGDELLEVEDALRDSDDEVGAAKPRKSFLKLFVGKRALKIYAVLLLLAVAGAAAWPTSRYFALNAAGVRSSSSLTVVDATSQQPLKNVSVTLGNVSAKTAADGSVHLSHLKLGKTSLKIDRIAFASVEKTVVLGWGSNPLGSLSLTPTGAQYKIQANDVLSGKGVATAQAETGDAAAHADANGLITLTLPQTDQTEVTVHVSASAYRDEVIKLSISSKDTAKVSLAPATKHIFASKRSGKFDIYSVYADGQDEKLLLAGSGNERDDLVLLPHAAGDTVAYVSTRAGKHNADGFLLSDLVLIDTATGKTTPIVDAERVQLVGWSGNRLVFVTVGSGASAADPNRNRLLSYNLDDGKTVELATSNYFNDLVMAHGQVYFAPSSALAGGTPAQFFRQNTDGAGQTSLLNQEVWNIIRTSYDHLALSVGQQWFDYKLGDSAAKKIDTAPVNKTSRVYLDSPSAKTSAWIDQRDGKGTLLVYDLASAKDVVVTARAGLSLPLVWLNDQTLVFRVQSNDEVADYAVSINGGDPKKIRDVSKTAGIDNWYYY